MRADRRKGPNPDADFVALFGNLSPWCFVVEVAVAESRPSVPSLADRVVRWVAGPPGWFTDAPATRLLLWVHGSIFAAQLLLARLEGWSFGLRLPTSVLLAFGANYPPATWGESRVEVLVASLFVHASVPQLLLNLLALRSVGPVAEHVLGSYRFVPLYLATGILGSALSASLSAMGMTGEPIGAGAAAPIMGLLGASAGVGTRMGEGQSLLTQASLRWAFVFLVLGAAVNAFAGGANDPAAQLGALLSGLAFGLAGPTLPLRSLRAVRFVYVVCACLVVTSATTVAARTLASPFTSMTFADRIARAREVLAQGQCREARLAFRAADRIAQPANQSVLLHLGQDVDSKCRP